MIRMRGIDWQFRWYRTETMFLLNITVCIRTWFSRWLFIECIGIVSGKSCIDSIIDCFNITNWKKKNEKQKKSKTVIHFFGITWFESDSWMIGDVCAWRNFSRLVLMKCFLVWWLFGNSSWFNGNFRLSSCFSNDCDDVFLSFVSWRVVFRWSSSKLWYDNVYTNKRSIDKNTDNDFQWDLLVDDRIEFVKHIVFHLIVFVWHHFDDLY